MYSYVFSICLMYMYINIDMCVIFTMTRLVYMTHDDCVCVYTN